MFIAHTAEDPDIYWIICVGMKVPVASGAVLAEWENLFADLNNRVGPKAYEHYTVSEDFIASLQTTFESP